MTETATAPTPAPLLLDAHETAKTLGICERTLWTLTKRREIGCVRIGRRVLYDVRDLIVFIDRRKEGCLER